MLHETGGTIQHTPPEGTPAQSPGGKSGTTKDEVQKDTYSRDEYMGLRNKMSEQGRQAKGTYR